MMSEEIEKDSRKKAIKLAADKINTFGVKDISFEELMRETGNQEFETVEEFIEELVEYIMEESAGKLMAIKEQEEYSGLSGLEQIAALIKRQYIYVFEYSERLSVIYKMNAMTSKGEEYTTRYYEILEELTQESLKKGINDESIRSNINVSKVARLMAKDIGIRILGISEMCLQHSDRIHFVPVEQMEFYIEMIKNELRPVHRRKEPGENLRKTYDSLTGLLGKESFYEQVSKTLADNEEKEYEIVVTDIEKFKLINDNYGMQEGDKLLKYIANRIKVLTDPDHPLSSRIGADRFFTLIEHKNGQINHIVREAVEDIKNYSPGMNISLKFGIYKVTDKSLPLAFMCDRAALAANSIKGKYNVSCAYYDDSIRKSLLMEQRITNEMEKALAEEQFEVYFQPKYDLLTETIAGAEALVRWNHPELGFISPGIFVPIFEKNGFITKMDMFVWDKTCRYISRWKKQYGVCIPISVNVSRRDIYNADLTKIFLELVEKYDLEVDELHLEITETAYTEDSEQLVSVIDDLKRNGFIIEMDDFGSGYSSLNMLSEIPIDILKLDMRFVQGKDLANNRNIMNFVMGLAKWMNLLVVAEGVETQDQINVLKALECNYVQGYFYSKPLPAEEFSSQLATTDRDNAAEILKYGGENGEVYVQSGGSEKVLLVVDSVLWNCNLIYEYFKDSYTVAYTGNGNSAWNYILDHHEKIEMVISDLAVPGMSGMELIMKIRSDKNFADIPIIATSQFGQGGEEMALTLGASDFVQKPYGRGVMIRRVQNILLQCSIRKNQKGKTEEEEDMDKAKLDPSTGLYNQEKMESEIYAFIKKKISKKSVFLVIDIDDFKNITEMCGYSMGEMIIKNVVSVLKNSFRKDEVISHSGGDEFCVFLPEGFTDESLKKRMNRLVKDFKLEVDDMKITCSIGVCKYPEGAKNYEELYQHAKEALNTAKESGKNQYKIYGD